MTYIDYASLYFITCLIQFLLFCRTGRKRELPLERWDIDFLFKNIGKSLIYWAFYVYPILKKIGNELKKERKYVPSNQKF